MTKNERRIGNFTSSEIYNLLSLGKRDMTPEEIEGHKKLYPKSKKRTIEDGIGKAGLAYISEKNMERRLGRTLNQIGSARPLIWGKTLEGMVFELLGLNYALTSQDTLIHPRYDYWAGSPDGVTSDTVFDIKCPFTLKSFCQFADCETIDDVRKNHPDGEKYYWQLISNAILTGKKFAELIVYCPFRSEIPKIQEECSMFYEGEQNNISWIAYSDPDELPHIPDKCYYNNMYTFRFGVCELDKNLLTERVVLCSEKLVERYGK
jgi:hypothetical protein